MKRTIVFILSANYSGSHFLSLLLGSNSQAMHVGETKRLRKLAPGEGAVPCHLCRDTGNCPVLGGIDASNVDKVFDIIFARVDPRVLALIDNSKTVRGWADRFVACDTYQKKYIHLVRDPRAIVRRGLLNNAQATLRERMGIRWDVVKAQPDLFLPLLFARETEVYLYRWLARNQIIQRFFEAYRLDSCLVTYEELATDTPTQLKRITEWIGLEYEPSQLEYWNVPHHGTQKPEYEWVKEKKTQHLDQRWKESLPCKTQELILRNRAVNEYLARLGLGFNEDGIARKGPAGESPRQTD